MNDSLRDRIAALVENALPREHTGYGSGEEAAQAVIDNLGLTDEQHQATESERTMHRVVGEWEWHG